MLVLFLTCGLLVSVSGNAALSKAALDIVEGNKAFASNVYKILAETPGNILFSPISAHSLLALAYVGSGGNTATEMATVLSVPNDQAAVSVGYKNFIDQMKEEDKFEQVTVANKIYAAKDLHLEDDFKTMAETNFRTGIENVDFNDATHAADAINKFVATKTHDKIKDVVKVDDFGPQVAMTLISAIHFMGKWKNPFTPLIYPLEFHLNNQQTENVNQMAYDGRVGYKNDTELGAQIFELSYTSGFMMTIVLPNEIEGLASIEKKMTINFDEELPSQKVYLRFPKFEFKTNTDGLNVLQKLGMKDAFGTGADFKKMVKDPVHISKARQSAFISVDETGTEAAAATVVGVHYMSLTVSRNPTILVDRPFLFAIHKKAETGPIFIGRFAVPEKKSKLSEEGFYIAPKNRV